MDLRTDSLTEFGADLPAEQQSRVCAEYPLDLAGPVEPAGGTASPKVILGRRPQRYLLRRRRAEFSAPDVVAFDHAVIRHLAQAGLPVVPPEPTRSGATAVFLPPWAFELFRYIEDLTFYDPEDDDQLAQAGDLLGRLHALTADFHPPGRKTWTREFHMGVNRHTLEEALARLPAADGDTHRLAGRVLEEARRVEAHLPDDLVGRLPTVIVHGDFTWANLMYREARLAGLFDFDWTYRQTPLDDLARGILFLAFRRPTPLRADSIWHLLAPWTGDLDRARLFLKAYEGHRPLSGEERRLLPWFVREAWLGARIRGMRKVPEPRKLEFLTAGIGPTLDWWSCLDELTTP